MTSYTLGFDEEFDDHASITESKGWYPARLTVKAKQYQLTFYDPVRLRQEIEDELKRSRVFYEPNLIVISSVTRQNMEEAIEALVQSGEFGSLNPE